MKDRSLQCNKSLMLRLEKQSEVEASCPKRADVENVRRVHVVSVSKAKTQANSDKKSVRPR